MDGRDQRDEALAVVEAHAALLWKQAAEKIVRELPVGTRFTTDKVHHRLKTMNMSTREPRALGAVMMHLARQGAIKKTDEYRQSIRPECHARPVPVWVRL